jgi:steroid 5-alpha reductase family enzyme
MADMVRRIVTVVGILAVALLLTGAGLYLFGLAANPGWWWTIIGPVAITALFLGISVPMMDTRMLARHPGYAEHIAARSGLVPWPARQGADSQEEDA